MRDNTYIQKVAIVNSREREPSISATFVRLNVLDYKRAEQSDHKKDVVETALLTSYVFAICENLTNKSQHIRRGCELNNEQIVGQAGIAIIIVV